MGWTSILTFCLETWHVDYVNGIWRVREPHLVLTGRPTSKVYWGSAYYWMDLSFPLYFLYPRSVESYWHRWSLVIVVCRLHPTLLIPTFYKPSLFGCFSFIRTTTRKEIGFKNFLVNQVFKPPVGLGLYIGNFSVFRKSRVYDVLSL